MKLPYSWLKELIPELPTVSELEPILAQMGLPLEEIEYKPALPNGVVVVEVISTEAVPDTKLTKIVFQAGTFGEQIIVSGAPNAASLQRGDQLVLITPGTTIGGITYGIRELQGISSWGMAASEKELGIGENNAGLMILPKDSAVAGTPFADIWPEDTVLDIEVTPNRADVLSVYGLARDLAAYLKLDLPSLPVYPAPVDSSELTVQLPDQPKVLERDPTQQARQGCDLFATQIVKDLHNGPSPLWLQRRLQLCGLRPHDLIVDISQYVMLECGQPTAVYDRRDVGTGLKVGYTQGAIQDLLGHTLELTQEDLVVMNSDDQVLSLAGVVGAAHGQIRPDTTEVVIESAHFDSVMLRLTSTRLGLKTDAVYRFERGVDPALPYHAAARIAELLAACGGTPESGITIVGQPSAATDIVVDPQKIRALLGMDISDETMKELLERLGCVVSADWKVTPPSWRIDLHLWQDIAEEVARLHGFSQLPETLPRLSIHSSNYQASKESVLRGRLRHQLAGMGFQEVVTYTFSHEGDTEIYSTEPLAIRLRNPMGAERTGLRTALYPSLIKAAKTSDRALLFEIGRIFPASGECERLGLLMRGPLVPQTYQPGIKGTLSVFKGMLESLALSQGAKLEIRQWREQVSAALHPGIAGQVFWNGTLVGWMGALHPQIAGQIDVPTDLFIAELSLPLPVGEWSFHDPKKAPASWRDLAIIAPNTVSYGEIAAVLQQAGGELLEKIEPFDVYHGEQIGAGQRSVAVRLTYRGEQTLTDEITDPIFQAQIAAIRAQGWMIRDK